MPRPMWSGAISFGLINVPIKLYNATRKKALQFHQLRAADGCRIRLKRVCPADGKEVPNEEIVKGYEVSPEQYVVISDEELQTLNPKSTKTIDIQDFVKLEQIDPIYFDHSYYLIPDKGAGKAYNLLFTALEKSQKTAIAKFVIHSKEYLAAIRPSRGLLALSTMFFADEVAAIDELTELLPERGEPNERELTMAQQLIDSLSTDFDPAKYRDEYRQSVMELIERKAEGETVSATPAPAQPGKVVDLMAALEASLAAIKEKTPAKNRRKKARAQ